MKIKYLEDLMLWIFQELKSVKYGEIHIVLKVRDYQVVLVEKVKNIKEKPLE
jgi:hypothetical protein